MKHLTYFCTVGLLKICLLSGLLSSSAVAQIGGKNAFQFLQLPSGTHVAGIGAENVSVVDRSAGMVWHNPALLSDTMNGDLMLTLHPYYAGIFHSHVQYATRIKDSGLWSFGLQYINYGTMDQNLANGSNVGTFKPSEYSFAVSKSHTINLFSIGGTLKIAGSQITSAYNAYALLADIGGSFKHPTQDLSVGLAIKNIGFPIKNYYEDEDLSTPFDVQLGATLKPKHLPLRVSLTAQKLYQFDISYNDPALDKQVNFDGTETKKEESILSKGFRHMVIGAEVLLGRNFHIRLGYNALLRRDLRLPNKGGLAGLSWGFMLRVKRFEVSFTRAYYQVQGGTNYIGLVLNTRDLFGRKHN